MTYNEPDKEAIIAAFHKLAEDLRAEDEEANAAFVEIVLIPYVSEWMLRFYKEGWTIEDGMASICGGCSTILQNFIVNFTSPECHSRLREDGIQMIDDAIQNTEDIDISKGKMH